MLVAREGTSCHQLVAPSLLGPVVLRDTWETVEGSTGSVASGRRAT